MLFSINDLLIFSGNKSIKLMTIVNKEGEISFLLKPNSIDLNFVVFKNILQFVPNFIEKKEEWEYNNKDKEFKLQYILNKKERKNIIEQTLEDFMRKGVIYCDYLGQDMLRNMSQNNINISMNASNIDCINNSLNAINSICLNEEEEYDEYSWEE